MDFLKERKEKRFDFLDNKIISTKMYNLIIGATILYGLVVNIIMSLIIIDYNKLLNIKYLSIICFLSCLFGSFLSYKSSNAIISFIGYNFVVIPFGIILSISVSYYTKLSFFIVIEALILTIIITIIMIISSIFFINFFKKLGFILFNSLLAIIISEIIFLLLGIKQYITSWIAAIIFSLYIGYDFYKSQQYVKTIDNAVDSALDIYMDIINLFLRILSILGGSKNKR